MVDVFNHNSFITLWLICLYQVLCICLHVLVHNLHGKNGRSLVYSLLSLVHNYDACASVALRASGLRWNRLDFYSSVASWALASVQPIRLSKNLTSGMQFDWWKRLFSVTLTTLVTLAAPASYCEPSFTCCYVISCCQTGYYAKTVDIYKFKVH